MRRSRQDLLDHRARHLLRALIGQYIQDGEPVGSRTLARASGLDLSPATIRNVLSDLEELGLIRAPHTSAGRIPTAQGYRLFVDALLELKPPSHDEVEHWQHNLHSGQSTQDVLQQASSVLSQLTHFVGVVTVPKRSQFAFRQIDFVRLAPNRLLVILVFTDNEVQNRVIELPRAYTPSELEEIANFLNANYAGRSLDEIRTRLVGDLQAAKDSIDRLMRSAIEIADASFRVDTEAEMLLAGATNLMAQPELADLERLRELFEAFQQKRELVRLMEQCIHADGVRLFIGEESGFAPLGQCSVITAPYGAAGKVLGVLGVIGPTRMAYDRVIPVVQTTAQILSQSLSRISG
ncbi:heat-inducible transcriptional repressor HrcA [Ahniella affigens]|uniref:Heat-inducible transcription repressor HrcA n=1 Tax=Ahniella affigens TaxID=2021234 RepID=A0A2P1PTK9_9GAMM|nr:heat-inducible transcriptional repressor HrcA [Ahniella affigens]